MAGGRRASDEDRGRSELVRGRELEEVRERDPDGAVVVTTGRSTRSARCYGPARSVTKCTARPWISRADFIVANIDPLRALPILRVPGSGREPDLSERQVDARRRVHVALDRLGGLASPGGSCIWHVVGMQHSVRHWALRQGWGGRPVRQEAARASWSRRWACWWRTTATALGERPDRGRRQHRATLNRVPIDNVRRKM